MVLYIAAPPPGHKTCTKCGQCEKHSKNKSTRDGLQSQCVQCNKALNKKYYESHKNEIIARSRQRYQEKKDEIIAQHSEYKRNRYQTDDAFRLLTICRARLRDALKEKQKTAKTLELIGCTPDELLEHLERTMSPEVRALRDDGVEIVIDHIIPCAAFDFSIAEHQRVCFNYTNLQYLDKPTNMSKSDTLPPGFDFASWFAARATSIKISPL
ncbi:MAG: hypothetical protein CL494_05030 [Actinobacteria bacterium]|nr:hypothetical protein [Actinomycetota bacterium]